MPKMDAAKQRERRIRTFNKQAPGYERRRKNNDLRVWREQLLASASGEVLELAVGAGANFPFYPPDVQITAVDFSPQMISKAKEAAEDHDLAPRFILCDAEEVDFPDNTFDTIVSTLSFCSYQDPEAMLAKVNRWCKPGGKILLLEHGRSTWKAVATVQKWLNPLVYRIIGCHQSRDIRGLLIQSELVIQRLENHFLNTVSLVWATPGKS